MGGAGVLDDDVYVYDLALFLLKSGKSLSHVWKEVTYSEAKRRTVYRFLLNGLHELKKVWDPRVTAADGLALNIVRKVNDKIVVKESEVSAIVRLYFQRYKGGSARKLHAIIANHFEGVSVPTIQK